MLVQSNIAVYDHGRFMAAVVCAERRALHSYFDQHILEDGECGFVAIDEGDYNSLSSDQIDRIVHTIPGAMNDDQA